MNFCNTYFGKDLDKLTSEDLVHFFSIPRKESQYLEFKSSREKNVDKVYSNTLKPSICSFLNSEGGLLIYGAPKEDRQSPNHPFHNDLEPYETGFLGDHDTIISKLSGGIIPMPVGIRLKEVEFQTGRVAVFEIQPSQTKPHQVDNLYQIRIDGQKKPAPHFLIQALMREVKFPDLAMQIKFEFFGSDHSYHYLEFKSLIFNKVDSINEKNIELKIVASIQGHTFNQHLKTFPLLSYGLPIAFNNNIKLTNPHFIITNHNLLEVAFIFGGDNSSKRISYYKFRLPGRKLKQEFQDIWLYKSVENMRVSDFLIEFPNQNIIKLLE